MSKCPGQDTQMWGFDAIYDVDCPQCGAAIEFFKDQVKKRCSQCREVVFNERMDLGCAKWCPSADSCVGPDNVAALELSEQRKLRRANLVALLELVPAGQEAVRELFKTLYSEYAGEDKLFDTNRLYSVQEDNPGLFEAATESFREFLAAQAATREREAQARARTEEMLRHDQRKKRKEGSEFAQKGA
ncbi:MAG: hypothetical protein P1P84_12730 [Deferrisomatales bacterium]|nr:hypothetical protein [Deferrisomatales bacterium]